MAIEVNMQFSNVSIITSVLVVGLLIAAPAMAQTTVVVDPTKKYQTFEGFGSSLCWWAVKVGAWNETNRNKLLGAIADPDTGLGYTYFRYNIGGGDQPGHNHLTKGDGGAAVPGYKPSENGSYDWNADASQRVVATTLAKMAKDPIFEAFSNSPPWWMTNSGCVSGGVNGADNLKTDYYDDFADYLSEVALHFKKEWGITFRTVEPFNEPSAGWWKANGDQEGCGFKNNQSKMIVELGKKLKEKGLFPETSVGAADESNISDALNQFKGYSEEALSYIFQVNTHSYSGYDSRAGLFNAAFAKNKKVVQSETGPLHKSGDENIALWMAGLIIADIRDMKASAWVDWQLGDPAENWRSFALDHLKQTYKPNARYYMHAAFSRVLRPGSRIIDSDNGNTLAALRGDGALVLIVRNSGTADASYNFDLSGFDKLGTAAKVNVFALPGSLTAVSDLSVTGKSLAITAKANTVTTLVIPSVEANGQCTPSDIIPYVKIGNGGWNEQTEVNIEKGDSLRIGPHPWEGGRWIWSGPKDFSTTNREFILRNMDGTMSGHYKAQYTNAVGCESSVDFKVIVNDAEYPYVEPADTPLTNLTTEKQRMTLDLLQQQHYMTLYDMQGVIVYHARVNGGHITVPNQGITRGRYILQVRNNRGQVVMQKTIAKR